MEQHAAWKAAVPGVLGAPASGRLDGMSGWMWRVGLWNTPPGRQRSQPPAVPARLHTCRPPGPDSTLIRRYRRIDMLPPLPPAWRAPLQSFTDHPGYRQLDAFLDAEVAAGKTILPAAPNIFRALELTPPDKVKAVILGQDPYPTPGHAHGLCFSVQPDVRPIPRSLVTIYKELHDDVGFMAPAHGFLEAWARQGVLMLNTLLTVPAGDANGHKGRGWEPFTDQVLRVVAARPQRVVFLLWGKPAQAKKPLVDQPQHRVLEAFHPSPLNRGKFLGCRCFSQTNTLLAEAGIAPIQWQV